MSQLLSGHERRVRILEKIQSLDTLPSLPRVVSEMLRLLSDERTAAVAPRVRTPAGPRRRASRSPAPSSRTAAYFESFAGCEGSEGSSLRIQMLR